MSDVNPERAYRPIDAESGDGARVLLRALVPLLIAGCAVVLFAPSAIRYFAPGWQGGASADLLARVAAFGVLAVALAATGIADQVRRQERQRETWRAFADEMGGALTIQPLRVTASGAGEDGPRVAYTIGGRPVVLTCYGPRSSGRYTRLAAALVLGRDVQFQILANTTANRILMSGAIWSPLLAMASREARKEPKGDAQARAVERMRFLATESVVTGDASFDAAFLLKATDEATARDLAADPSARSALDALVKRDRYFRLSLVAADAPGPAQLEVELMGTIADLERLRAMHQLLHAVMARLDRSGILDTGARRAS